MYYRCYPTVRKRARYPKHQIFRDKLNFTCQDLKGHMTKPKPINTSLRFMFPVYFRLILQYYLQPHASQIPMIIASVPIILELGAVVIMVIWEGQVDLGSGLRV